MTQARPLPEAVPVLIAGGGTVGLALAALLARHGVASLVVEAGEGDDSGGRVLRISRRSQEILWNAGAGAALAVPALPLNGGSEPVERFASSIDVRQDQVESALDTAVGHVPELVQLARSTRVAQVQPRDDGVIVEVAGPQGTRAVRADWLVACDGGAVRAQSRVLLAGDAAQLGTTPGMGGLDAGLEDVANLAWKLAAVVDGDAGAALIDSYAQERLQAARENTAGIGYPGSPLNGPHEGAWASEEAAPGQLAPEALLQGPQGDFHLSQAFGTDFTCLVLGDGALPHAVADLAQHGVAVLDIAPEADAQGQARMRYGLPDAQAMGLVLVRPDGYVMGRWRGLDPAPVLACLRAKGLRP